MRTNLPKQPRVREAGTVCWQQKPRNLQQALLTIPNAGPINSPCTTYPLPCMNCHLLGPLSRSACSTFRHLLGPLNPSCMNYPLPPSGLPDPLMQHSPS